MTTNIEQKSGFAMAAESDSGLQGDVVRHNGKTDEWTRDGVVLETGEEGTRLIMLMPTALAGSVLWDDFKIAERDIGLTAAGRALPDSVEQGWNPAVYCQCIEPGGKEIMTFASTNWGGVRAFKKLAVLYHTSGETCFPYATLHSKSRDDAHNNFDPVFRVVGWLPRDDFESLLPERPAVIEHKPAPKRLTKLEDELDDVF